MAEIIKVALRGNMNEWDDIRPHVDTTIKWNDLGAAPLHTMLMLLNGTETVKDTRFRWPERQADMWQVTVDSAINVSGAGVAQAATIATTKVTIGDVLYHGASRQRFQVTAITSRTTTTVCEITKIPITSATTAVSAGAVCRVLPMLMNEDAYYPTGKGGTPDWHFNYTQVSAYSVAISNTMAKVESWVDGGQWQNDITEAVANIRGQQERGFIWGSKISESRTLGSEITSSTTTSKLQSSQGLDDRITTHRTTYSGTPTRATINAWIQAHVFNSRTSSSSRQKTLVVGPDMQQAINDMAGDQLQVFQGAEEYGLNIRKWIIGTRELAIVEEREFLDNTEDAGTAYAIEPENMALCILGDTYMEVKDTSPIEQRIKRVTYEWEGGYKIPQEFRHAKLSKV